LLAANELVLWRPNRRLLPLREFIKYMYTNEIHCIGRGVETHSLQFGWNNSVRVGNATSTDCAFSI